MIGQGHCILCGIEILEPDEAGEDKLAVAIEARGFGDRVEWRGDAHPDCVRALWRRLEESSVVPGGGS